MILIVILRSYAFFVDEDLNGIIDRRELKKCFDGLEILLTEEEIDDLFEACDISAAMGIKFNEFIVLLCLVYLLKDDPDAVFSVSECFVFAFQAACSFILFLYAFPFLFPDFNRNLNLECRNWRRHSNHWLMHSCSWTRIRMDM